MLHSFSGAPSESPPKGNDASSADTMEDGVLLLLDNSFIFMLANYFFTLNMAEEKSGSRQNRFSNGGEEK